ncbi:hypothetical protein NE237_027912 [Protea cynaroides]|uniref:C2 tensin-type domain-containing protein n=1 Tax=Protea cynaroides TaxID=273540 RepID=A0A9Q0JUN1_9MAGN|nr:hypothetical protein NE237_027912 [Protea cynaroides]
MMFRFMFNTAFIRSNILMLNREEIDILWDAKDRNGCCFFTDHGGFACVEEKEALPIEAFAKVLEIFSSVEWLDPKADVALNVLQPISVSNILQEKLETGSLQNAVTDSSQRIPQNSVSRPVSPPNSLQGLQESMSRYHSASSALGITALLHDHASY